MVKDSFSNSATTAFLQYAQLGRPTGAQIKENIRQQVYAQHCHKSRLEKQAIFQKELKSHRELIRDMDAVNLMLDMLNGKTPIPKEFHLNPANSFSVDIADALENIYFKNHRYNLGAKNLTLRVRRYAIFAPCDERTVWRALKYARTLFAELRGYTTEWYDEIKISNEN